MIITFNGTPIEYVGTALSYRKIAELAGAVQPSVTYKLRNGESGTLAPGDVIAVSEGMVINAYRTGDA